MIYFLTKNKDHYKFENVTVTDDEQACENILMTQEVMGYDKEATSLNTLLARELLDSWGNDKVQVVVDKTTIPVFGQKVADKFILNGFNIKYDQTLAKVNGLNITRVNDAMLRDQRLGQGSGRVNNLVAVYERRTGKKFPTHKSTRDDFINWPKNKFFEEHHVVYSAYDVQVLPEIIKEQDRLVEIANMHLLISIENKLCPILGNMEIEGFHLNDPKWLELIRENTELKAESELKMDAILEQMKPIFPALNKYTFKRQFNAQQNLFFEATEKNVKTFNYNSTDKILEIFDELKLPKPMLNKKDEKLKKKVLKPSAAEDALKEYLIKYPKTPLKPFLSELLIHKKLEKRLNSFGKRFLYSEIRTKQGTRMGYKNPITGRVHTTYRQCMTATGRLASGDADFGYYNSQQLPKDNRYRNCFTLSEEEKKEGWEICTLDLAGAEVVIAASLSGEVKILQMKDIHSELATPAYRKVLAHILKTYKGEDLHSSVKLLLSSSKFDATDELVNEAINSPDTFEINKSDKLRAEIRDDFKAIVYGSFYGGTSSRIAEVLNIPVKWADLIYASLKESLPLLFKYLEDNAKVALDNGYVIFNNRTNSKHIFESYLSAAQYGRNLTNLERSQIERDSKNYPIQGTQADMMKEAIVEVFERVDPTRFVLKLQVHDEIVFKFKGQEIVDQVQAIVVEVCNRYLINGIEMKADYHINDYWEK